MYSEQGRGGVARDITAAVAWYKRACEGDSNGATDAVTDRSHIPAYAQYNYARVLWFGLGGTKKDVARAYHYIIKAYHHHDSHNHSSDSHSTAAGNNDEEIKKLYDIIYGAQQKKPISLMNMAR
jgi:TPR repeat protein